MQNALLRITIHRHALVQNEAAGLLGRTSRRSRSDIAAAARPAEVAAVTAPSGIAKVRSLRRARGSWISSRPVPAGACLPACAQLRLDSLALFASLAPLSTSTSLRQYSTAAIHSAIRSLRQGSLALAVHRVGARRQHTNPAQDKADAEDDRLLPHGRSSRSRGPDAAQINRDFILSILHAQPSARDSRSYLKAFGSDVQRERSSSPGQGSSARGLQSARREAAASETADSSVELATSTSKPTESPLVEALLNPITRHTAIVKVQGPFTARQLSSIAEGLVYLDRLGLVSIVVVDEEAWSAAGHLGAEASQLRKEMVGIATLLAEVIEEKGGRAVPLINDLFRLGSPGPPVTDLHEGDPVLGLADESADPPRQLDLPVVNVHSLRSLKAAIGRGEIPIIPPIARDADLATIAIHANDAIRALVASLAVEGELQENAPSQLSDIDLTPLRMMVINREGGIPSPARGGNPHLSINLESEFGYIHDTFIWHKSHPTSLANLDLLQSCLALLPRDSSAILVSHRSPKALIANLITNKPAHSPSLHHSLLPARHIQHTPTIVRKGLPIRVIRDMASVDKAQLTRLLEASFRKTLNADEYFARLERDLDCVIVAGYPGRPERDYQAAAIVTLEKDAEGGNTVPICYLDKFAVLPSLQGDGTVDFLWTALRDETFGLGLLDALNPNGGKEGIGRGTDLVWRSRADNPVNRWYFERSNGFVNLPEMGKGGTPGTLFWADAEDRIRSQLEGDEGGGERRSVSVVMAEEEGRLQRWARVIGAIKSCWK